MDTPEGFVENDERYPLLKRYKEPPKPPRQSQITQPQIVQPQTNTITTEEVPEDNTPSKGRRSLIWIILIVLVILIVIGVLVWFFFLRSKSTTTGTGTGTTPGVLNETCSASNPCAIIFTCDSGICKSQLNGPCELNTDCSQTSSTLVCTGSPGNGGQCKKPNGSSCTQPSDCINAFCSGGTCASCTADTDCQTNQHCVSGKCQ